MLSGRGEVIKKLLRNAEVRIFNPRRRPTLLLVELFHSGFYLHQVMGSGASIDEDETTNTVRNTSFQPTYDMA